MESIERTDRQPRRPRPGPPVRVGATRVKPAVPYDPAIVADFETWFSHYPPGRHSHKAASMRLYAAVRARGIDKNVLLNALHNFRMRSNPDFIPLPDAWLNRERWVDERKDSAFMNDLAKHNDADNDNRLCQSVLAEPPELERWLEAAVLGVCRGHAPPVMTLRQRAEAATVAGAYQELLRPAIARDALMAWLEPLYDAVKQAPSQEKYDGRVAGVLLGGADLPNATLNAASQKTAVRRFARWPAVPEVIELLEQQAVLLRRRAQALLTLSRADRNEEVGASQARPKVEVATPEAKAAVELRLAAFRRKSAEVKPRIVSSYHSSEQLRRLYTAQAASPDSKVAAFATLRLRIMQPPPPA